MPAWGADLSTIDFDRIHYYMRPTERVVSNWDDVPADIRATYQKIGIPEAEQKYSSGVMAQYESEAVYHSLQSHLEKQGVIFDDMDTGLKKHPEIVRQLFWHRRTRWG